VSPAAEKVARADGARADIARLLAIARQRAKVRFSRERGTLFAPCRRVHYMQVHAVETEAMRRWCVNAFQARDMPKMTATNVA